MGEEWKVLTELICVGDSSWRATSCCSTDQSSSLQSIMWGSKSAFKDLFNVDIKGKWVSKKSTSRETKSF